MSDNEDTTASLWDSPSEAACSDVLSVQSSGGEPIPEFDQAPEDGSKVPSAVRRQDAGDVLPYQPVGAQALSQPKILERQVAAVVVQPAAESGDAEGLAGGASDKESNRPILACADRREVAMKRNPRVSVLKDRPRERVDLGIEGRLEAVRGPRHRRGLDAAADAAETDHASPFRTARSWCSEQ
jgi:hypothetical protein